MRRGLLRPARRALGAAVGVPLAEGGLNLGVDVQEERAFLGDGMNARVVAEDGEQQRGAAVTAADDEQGVVDLLGAGGFQGEALRLTVLLDLGGIELERQAARLGGERSAQALEAARIGRRAGEGDGATQRGHGAADEPLADQVVGPLLIHAPVERLQERGEGLRALTPLAVRDGAREGLLGVVGGWGGEVTAHFVRILSGCSA